MKLAHLQGVSLLQLLSQGLEEVRAGKKDARFPIGLDKIKTALQFLELGYSKDFEPYELLLVSNPDDLPRTYALIGLKVCYKHFNGDLERGIILSINGPLNKAHVVYNCGGDWNKYENYTGVETPLNRLKFSW